MIANKCPHIEVWVVDISGPSRGRICNRIIMIHNGKIVADGSPEDLLSQQNMSDLEELYVNLTQEDAVLHHEDKERESKISQLWRQLMTKTKRTIKEEEE